MDLLQNFILSVIQGLTEFLPISSSAHLILLPKFTGWRDQGLAFDVAVHFGTLLAVLYFFRCEIKALFCAWVDSLLKNKHTQESKLAWSIGIATIPVGLAGLLFKGLVENNLRSTNVIAIATIVFGIILWLSAIFGVNNKKNENNLSWKDIIIIGLAQSLALIPGTSRSGITITAGLFIGLTKEAAARYSFLLAIPVIILAGGLETAELIKTKTIVDWSSIFTGIFISFITAYYCIKYFLKLLHKVGFTPFVAYRLFLGTFLLFMFHWKF